MPANRPLALMTGTQSTINNLQGVGSIAASSDLAILGVEIIAWPGARFGSLFHKLLSTPPMERFRRLTTLASLILCRIKLLIRPNTSSGRC